MAELEIRYGIVRSRVYGRFEKLKIKPQRMGRNSFITESELVLMDGLHTHIKGGGTTAEFLTRLGIAQPISLADRALDCFRVLEEACKQQWLLGSSQLGPLLGVSAAKIERFEGSFSDGGFEFCREGSRLTGEAATVLTLCSLTSLWQPSFSRTSC